jgi:N-formylglutamate amidohydrolase
MASDSFICSHFNPLAGPVLLSVPHAGRDYDLALLAGLRVPVVSILPLEDRYADRLADAATASGVPTIIAQVPRLALDLNRAADDLDPESIRGGFSRGVPASARARAGLGLIPTRLWGVGPLWRKPFDPADIAARVRDIHAPYHAAIARALAEAKLRWGSALLIDLHSMPPVAGDDAPDIVIGDRFGSSASSQLTATAEAMLKGLGFRVALNTPYAGGYIVSRHARPGANIHAMQIEIDRRLYLDADLDKPGQGLARMQRVVAHLVESLTNELTAGFAAAAE